MPALRVQIPQVQGGLRDVAEGRAEGGVSLDRGVGADARDVPSEIPSKVLRRSPCAFDERGLRCDDDAGDEKPQHLGHGLLLGLF